tara:strand:- start:1121 stop:1348 length:228 start_codon:yes stop_codon:yes gene_type:complete
MIAVKRKTQTAHNLTSDAMLFTQQASGILGVSKHSTCEGVFDTADEYLETAIERLQRAVKQLRHARSILKDKRKA